ncbi:MAG: SRPBCC domain-containing protein [Nocardioidaceae bacterium]
MYDAITGDVGAWWGSPYMLMEKPGTTIHIDATIGAPLVETCAGEERLLGIISAVKPGETLAWTGQIGIGPLAWGEVEFTLADADEQTRVTVTHEMFGGFGEGMGESYNYGWDDLLHRLQAYLVDGVSYGIAGKNSEPEGFEHTPSS